MAKVKKLRRNYDENRPLKVCELIAILEQFEQNSSVSVDIADGADNVRKVFNFAIADDDGTFFAV